MTSQQIPTIRSGVPSGEATTSPQLARVRTVPSGQATRSSIRYGDSVAREFWWTATTCSRSSGTSISMNFSYEALNDCGSRP